MLFRFLKALFGTNKPRKTSVKGYLRKQAVKAQETPFPTSKVPTVEARTPEKTVLKGPCYVVDGDTIRIDKKTIRLSGIDAPELHHPWGKKAKWELFRLTKGQVVTASLEPEASYDRAVAVCTLSDGTDLSAEMVKLGLALDWEKFSGGKYSHLEPSGVRKKLWRCAAKHKGKFFEAPKNGG
jgi:endonuclease YncB( thermonuclease family)